MDLSFLSKINLSQNFDARSALSGLYLWLLFGYLSSMVSCDMQRWMNDSIVFRHFVGVVAFFFLFTIIDTNNVSPIYVIWAKTIGIYFIFLLMVKSKWYFSLPVLIILIIDQSLKSQSDYLTKTSPNDKQIIELNKTRDALYLIMLGLIVIGFFHYFFRQLYEFGPDFSFTKLLFSSKCKKLHFDNDD
jgi:hypothetical protein